MACDPTVTPILLNTTPGSGAGRDLPDTTDRNPWRGCPDQPGEDPGTDRPGHAGPPTPADRIAALAALMLTGPRQPLAVGRTSRTATPAQRRALATRDRGCIVPGCQIPAENCQAHHLTDWADGGQTEIANLALLCWTHHRQLDLGMWTIHPTPPGANGTPPEPAPGAPPGTAWPANNNAPWTIRAHHRTRWRP